MRLRSRMHATDKGVKGNDIVLKNMVQYTFNDGFELQPMPSGNGLLFSYG